MNLDLMHTVVSLLRSPFLCPAQNPPNHSAHSAYVSPWNHQASQLVYPLPMIAASILSHISLQAIRQALLTITNVQLPSPLVFSKAPPPYITPSYTADISGLVGSHTSVILFGHSCRRVIGVRNVGC
jgi:hypothetical protein